MTSIQLPYQHLSIRVPWHDTGWTGTVCQDPLSNSACLRLSRIAEERDDQGEVELAGKPWQDLRDGNLPPCAAERASFMSPTPRRTQKTHPYAEWNEEYRRFKPTSYELPAYSADCVPFRWMLREPAAEVSSELNLPYQIELEEDVDRIAGLNSPVWVQHAHNQQLLLDTFFSAVQPGRTLAWIYAKETPLSDDPRRTLIGVGRVTSVGTVIPYIQDGEGFGSVLWERIIGHSIRPSMEDGFLLPYHDILANHIDWDIDPAEFAVFVPDEHTTQFSYAAEHVSHDASLGLLLELHRAVERMTPFVSGAWDGVKGWLSDRIADVWSSRGPCPGLGAALKAFGVDEGVLLAYAVQNEIAENEDPWVLVDAWMRNPDAHPEAARIGPTLSKMWIGLNEERRSLLKLLSRFALTPEQATRFYQSSERTKAGCDLSDRDIIENPYRIFEADRPSLEPVAVRTIDRGVFPADRVRAEHPLEPPARVDEPLDPRRVRALIVDVLEQRAVEGDSLCAQDQVIQDIRDAGLDPQCPLSVDAMAVCVAHLPPEVSLAKMADDSPAYQLDRLSKARTSIRREISRRRKSKPITVEADWAKAIDDQLESVAGPHDRDEIEARREKAAALKVLATSRVSVLVGAAGTGKTTLLRALASIAEVKQGGLLLLAPTGKARVRMQEAIRQNAFTLAQFLVRRGRYLPDTARYCRSDQDRYNSARTIIVDESSMITEDALDALLDAIEGFDRLILVGDPRQLPPIGVGRPFVDIVKYLQSFCEDMTFPRVGPSYAELTIPRRQVGSEGERPDLLLAGWYSGDEPTPGVDEVWDALGRGETFGSVAVQRWTSSSDLQVAIQETLVASLDEMADVDDAEGFQLSYGGTEYRGDVYFNRSSVGKTEAWQILSPVRGEGAGVNELNRFLHNRYRGDILELARNPGRYQRIPKPAGPQEVVYGDKVINIRNKPRRDHYPLDDNCLKYVANGEIGVITGPFRRKSGKKPPFGRLNVAFTTQPSVEYSFWRSEMGGDDTAPILELAYAITVHKSQGSEFEITFVVIPDPCRLLSRELLYTALTRHRERLVILHQGELHDLRGLASAGFSETARRLTNLFVDPDPVEVDGKLLEANLIHRTRKGIAVRSKSEVIIADLLYSKDIDFQYEQPIVGKDGSKRWPDFTIFDDTTGTNIYWEHLGLLHQDSYRRKWERKLRWYAANGILPHQDGGGEVGTLVTTEDGENGSISSADIEELVDDVLGEV
jgi:energy-coupling factor transporter ATP-binding protein EcfA2